MRSRFRDVALSATEERTWTEYKEMNHLNLDMHKYIRMKIGRLTTCTGHLGEDISDQSCPSPNWMFIQELKQKNQSTLLVEESKQQKAGKPHKYTHTGREKGRRREKERKRERERE